MIRRYRWVWPLLLLLSAWLVWQWLHSAPRALTLANGAKLEWGDCWFDKPFWRPIHCGHLYTAIEVGEKPPQFVLPVVYIPQWFWRRSMPPVQYIAGGPGGAAWLSADDIGYWFDWAAEMDWPGDLVLYDQRGVGLAQPHLQCDEVLKARRDLLPLELSFEEIARRLREATKACQARLQAEGIDLARFTTRANAADAIDLMHAMGLQRWSLYGVSYGTRVALEIMRLAPESLQSVVLDSVYPPQVNAELDDAWLLDRAFGLIARSCELTAKCSDTPDEIRRVLDIALKRLSIAPIRITVADVDGGEPLTVVYDQQDLAWLLFEALYDWHAIPTLPATLRALADGHVDANLQQLAEQSVQMMLDDSISDPVASSVDCHDNGPVARAAFDRQLAEFPRVAPIKRIDWEYHVCRFWQAGFAGDEFRRAVQSDVPTLLLAGEFDPVTPPEWAEQTITRLSHAQLFEFPAVGHGVLDSHLCAADLVRDFYRAPGAPRVPTCMDRL